MERRELSAADIYCKFAAQLDEDGFRLYHAAQRITGFQPYDAFPYEDNRGAFEAADGHMSKTVIRPSLTAIPLKMCRSCCARKHKKRKGVEREVHSP